MQLAALTDNNGLVVNIILVGDDPYTPPDGTSLHLLPQDSPVGIGWTRDGDNWAEPDPEPLAE